MSNPKLLKKLNGIAKASGCAFGKLGADQKFFVGNLKTVDKDGELDVPEDVIKIVATEFRQRAPDTAFMLVTVSQTAARVLIDIPKSRTELTADEWLAGTSMGGYEKKLEEGEFLKFRDQIINEAFNFLRSRQLLVDDEEDEKCYTLDDEEDEE